MGREVHEQSDDVEFENYPPGCMGGIFNVLDFHNWYNVKKMLPHKKFNRGRRGRCCANPQTISMEREPVESQRLLDAEAETIQVQHQPRKTGSTNKRSGKARTEGFSKENDNKHWILGHSAKSQLQQTDSTHHLEPSGFGLGWMNPIILVGKRGDTSDMTSTKSKKHDVHERKDVNQHFEDKGDYGKHANNRRGTRNPKPASIKLDKQVSYNQVEAVDVLEIFKVNKDLFLDILQDPEVGISHHFPGKQTSKVVKLTKSGSFPMPDSPRSGYLRSRTLEHKQKEVWSFRRGEKFVAGAQLSKSKALARTDDRFRSIVKEEASSSSQASDSQRWNHLVMNRLKDIKQRIKQALKERRKSINHTRANVLTLQVSSRDTLSTNEREASESSGKTASSCPPNNADDHDIENSRLRRMIRTKSINESVDRYTQLFQHSASKEANLNHSRSLKLSNEDKVPSRGNNAPKFFRRISSLSDLESFCSLLYEVSCDALSSEIPIRSIQDNETDKETGARKEPKPISFPEDIEKSELVEAVIEAELQENTWEGSNNRGSTGLSADISGEQIAKPCEFNEDAVELTQPTSDLSDIPMPEGLANEAEFFPKERRRISQGSVDYKTMGNSSRFLFFEPDREADPWYIYVKDILELSGFTQDEGRQIWFSPDQPLDPSMFKELETLLHPEVESTIDELGSNCNHQLVFNLVDEALLEIGEKSSVYFPKPFSFNTGISLKLKRNNVVEEVWNNVSKNLASQPEHDQSLDDIVAGDLNKNAWMNLQAESEVVALEMEDLVFDELLDELLCF
ncbi:TON1 Recruiting Motif 32 [Hibiscus trionum]|uniref:TON1 Recruiting Motif 32 n=1 Tax=Hibiscus trionum TaxID=183268 RepID=A0A9W7LZ81_HIBTR|nr:TON1 Recruiting Motif 32 [Hibiscus trionum]